MKNILSPFEYKSGYLGVVRWNISFYTLPSYVFCPCLNIALQTLSKTTAKAN